MRNLSTGQNLPQLGPDDRQEGTCPPRVGLGCGMGALLQAKETGQTPKRRDTRNPPHPPPERQQWSQDPDAQSGEKGLPWWRSG